MSLVYISCLDINSTVIIDCIPCLAGDFPTDASYKFFNLTIDGNINTENQQENYPKHLEKEVTIGEPNKHRPSTDDSQYNKAQNKKTFYKAK